MKKRVADIVIETLVELGVSDCFAVVGGGAMHLDNALALNQNMSKYFCHHEQACAMAADSYARLSGNPAMVCVTSGPGATNAITGVMGAWQDSIPMVVISGQVRYAVSVPQCGLPLRYRGTQEFEVIPAVKNMTKYAKMLLEPLSVKKEICEAYKMAMGGRRGPVWLDIPLDIQSAVIEEDDIEPFECHFQDLSPSDEDMEYVIDALRKAKRPCILAGSGIISGGARDLFDCFVESASIPVVGGAWVSDIFHNEHPFFFGLSGNIGPRTGNFILQNADVILSLGNSLGFRQTGFEQAAFAPQARIIMIDADRNEPKKPGLHIDKAVCSDVKQFFTSWINRSESIEIDEAWLGYCRHLKLRFDPFEAAEHLDPNERVCSYRFWKVFDDVAPRDVVLALGNNTACSAKLQVGKSEKEQRVITNYTCGSMGFDIPASVGAAVAGDQPVVCVTGDGSIMMNLQELQTIVQYELPVKVIVFSNDGYNAIRQTSQNFFNGVCIGCTADTGVSFPSFRRVAEAFGFDYLHCGTNGELGERLVSFFRFSGPVLLEIDQRLDDPVSPKVKSRLNEDGSFSTPALEDMHPFISKEEHDSLMLWKGAPCPTS